MSWPAARARNAPCAAAWQALAGAPERLAHANHSAYDLSSAVGPCGLCSASWRFWSTTSHEDDDVLAFPGWDPVVDAGIAGAVGAEAVGAGCGAGAGVGATGAGDGAGAGADAVTGS